MELTTQKREFSFNNLEQLNGNYQNVLFQDLDFSSLGEPFSFYRSDFRNSKFINVQFYKNNFDRTDFTSVLIQDCVFENTNFGNLGICNSLISNTKFQRVYMDGAEISRTKFENCLFDGVNFLNSTVFEIDFINCQFRGCIFEKAGFENIIFIDCDLSGSDLTDLTAVNFSFSNSILNGITISLDFLGTYLIDNFNMNDYRYRYLDKNINSKEINNKTISNFTEYLYYNNRYYEAFNLKLYFNTFQENELVLLFQTSLKNTLTIDNVYDRSENIKNLFKSLEFHFINSNIKFYDFLIILNSIKEIDFLENSFDVQYQINERYNYLNEKIKYGYFNTIIFNDKYISNKEVVLRLTFNLHDKVVGHNTLKIIFKNFNDYYKIDLNKLITIQNVYQGSIVFELLSIGLVAMLLSNFVKKITDNLKHITMNYAISKQILLTNKNNDIKSLKALHKILNSKDEIKINNDSLKKSINLIKAMEIEA